ncbi:MAG: mechanosensitive ion channel [Verrucomicrobia bacterium]|nr:mechanosensitive ion channel [Verrucomicrobiota bacterium]
MKARRCVTAQWILAGISLLSCLGGCSILPVRPVAGAHDRAFIDYWPPSENRKNRKPLSLAIKDNIDLKGVITTAGADPARVMEVLKTTVAAKPGVAEAPLPQAHVVSFSAGAVTFQLRAWTDGHENLAQLRSDLAVAVKEALAREQIAVA